MHASAKRSRLIYQTLSHSTHRMICDHVGADEDEDDVDGEPEKGWQDEADHVITVIQYCRIVKERFLHGMTSDQQIEEHKHNS